MATLAARFNRLSGLVRSDTPLTNDQICRAAPSVFAEAAHESRSARYTYIPTIQVIEGLRSEGFAPFFACQAKSRVEGKEEFTKHLLRFRHASQGAVADAVNEIILINSHDGSSSYQMLAGCFRFVCHNGLICGDTLEDFRVRHSGNIVGNVIEGAYRVLDDFQRVDAARDTMRQIQLRPEAQSVFSRAALQLRWDDGNAPIDAQQLNQARRRDDQGADLWRTFNRTQENLLRGGLPGRNRNGGRTSTREVRGVSENVRLNRALWTLAEEMAKLAA